MGASVHGCMIFREEIGVGLARVFLFVIGKLPKNLAKPDKRHPGLNLESSPTVVCRRRKCNKEESITFFLPERVPPRVEKQHFGAFMQKKTKPCISWANNVGLYPRIQKLGHFPICIGA